MRIGCIGLGVMGVPMAGHLARAGHALMLPDADPDRIRALAAAGEVVPARLPDEQVVQPVARWVESLWGTELRAGRPPCGDPS